MILSGDGNIEGLKLVGTEQKESSYSLRLKNGTTSIQIDCDKFYVYTPHFSGDYLGSENDMLILLNSDSLNMDNRYVKSYGVGKQNIEKKQSEGYLNELSVKDSQLIIDVNVDGIRNTFSRINPIRCMIDPILADVLKGKTRVVLPINDILFSGRALNELYQLQKTHIEERSEIKPNPKLESINEKPPEQHATQEKGPGSPPGG